MDNERLLVLKKRALQISTIYTIIVLVILLRLFYVQLIKHSFYTARSYEQRKSEIILSPDRGDIYDRNGNLLATSIDSYSVFINPLKVADKDKTARLLSVYLKEPKSSIISKLNSDKNFVWVKRKVEKPLVQALMSEDLQGVGFLSEKKRVYPRKKLASQVLGFVGTDNQGLSGIEMFYDRYLQGESGSLVSERDPRGREIVTSDLRIFKSPTDGMNITLTIDEPIQYRAEQAIKKAVQLNNAKTGYVIVMDVKTGDILALAAYPDFDPNDYQRYKQDIWYNRVVSDVYEPGSTFKLITVASALEEGVISKNSIVYCPDFVELGGKIIKNSHKLKFPSKNLTIEQILNESVNVGAVEIAKKIGKEKFYKHIKGFGFGEYSRVGLPGESRGILKPLKEWNIPDIGMISFGQSIAVTPIQLATSIAIIANNGVRVRPILVKKIESVDKSFYKVYKQENSSQVISGRTARDILDLAEGVVLRGTGKPAQIKNFRIGGKTGTAQKARPGGGGYITGSYVSSFIGIAPLASPKIVVLAVIDEPRPHYWGERVAAPVFKEVAEYSLRRLNVAPDKLLNSVI